MSEIKENRQYKDTVFSLIFGEHKDCAMALYNAVNGTNYTDVENLTIVTLRDALYIGRKDDAAFVFHDVLSMFEQQSSYNPNMPLRGLGYFSDSYTEYVAANYKSKNVLYSEMQIHIPAPKYYVLYNGTADQPESIDLRLSDAYDGEGDIEVVAHMLNINKGHNDELLNSCKPLKDYAELIDRIRKIKAYDSEEKDPIGKAVDSCIEDGILADILRKERARVANLLYAGMTEEEEKEFYKWENERKVQERVNEIVGKAVEKAVEEAVEKAVEEAVEKAVEEAVGESVEKSEDRFTQLNTKLLEDNRTEDLLHAATDTEYRESLYKEYGLCE